MIELSAPDGSMYCIDRYEVTNSNYKEFLDAGVPTAGQPTYCSWNSKYDPETTGGCSMGSFPYDPVGAGKNKAVSCVDWCDAFAYCAWAGKHLCGALDGGAVPPSDYANPNKNAWYNACSLGGTFDLPYGNVYDASYCNDGNSFASGPAASTSFPFCQGGVSGLFQMVGNVAEWENSCSGQSAASDLCSQRGGSFLSFPDSTKNGAATCDSSKLGGIPTAPPQMRRDERDQSIGFRCCYFLERLSPQPPPHLRGEGEEQEQGEGDTHA